MTSALIIQTRKEVRALLPWTIGVAVGSVAIAVVANGHASSADYRELSMFFTLAYVLGVLSVSALSVGQELTHGTLAALLVQPFDRRRLLVLKLVVLATALVGLGALADAVFPKGYLPEIPDLRRLVIWGPVVAGIGLTPLLTILSRRPLGGVVFSPTITGVILVVSDRLYPLDKHTFPWTITWYATLLVSAAGLIALFGQFRHLQVAGDGRSRTSHAAADRTKSAIPYTPTDRRPWLWLVVKKELQLQQMTFAVSGLYVLAGVASMILEATNELYVGPSFGAISIIHAYFIAAIAGAVASAEERNIGTLAGQILQPRNFRAQWAIKTTVTIGLALVLAFGLPMLMMAIHHPPDRFGAVFRVTLDAVLGIGLLCAASIWVSSLSSNPLWALLGSVPVVGLAGMFGSLGYGFVRRYVLSWWPYHWDPVRSRLLQGSIFQAGPRHAWLDPYWAASNDLQHSLRIIYVSLIVSFGVLVLAFAARNHRTLDRNARRPIFQAVILATFVAAAATGYLALSRWSDSWMQW